MWCKTVSDPSAAIPQFNMSSSQFPFHTKPHESWYFIYSAEWQKSLWNILSPSHHLPHLLMALCNVSVSLELQWQWDGAVSLITSVYSPPPPRTLLKLNFSTAPAGTGFSPGFSIQKWKKPDTKQEGWVFSPGHLCEAGFGWVMEALCSPEGLSWGWCTKSSGTKNCDH